MYMVYVTWPVLTTPLSDIVCHPWASTYYDQPIDLIWSHYLHLLRRYARRYKLSKMGWFGIGSMEIVPFDTADTSSYSIVGLTISLSFTVFRYSEILVDNRRFEPTLPLFGATVGATPLEFRRDLWHQKTRVHRCCLRDPIRLAVLVQYRCVTDRRTDTRQHIPR